MSHFAGGNLPPGFGPQVSQTSVHTNLATATTTPMTGTDALVYVVPVTGLYRCSVFIRIIGTASGAATHTFQPFITYNDGATHTAAAVTSTGTQTAAVVLPKTAGGVSSAMGVYRLIAGTTLTLSVNEACADTSGSGTTEVSYMVEQML